MTVLFNYPVSYGTKKRTITRRRESRFGDGYSQSTTAGINAQYQEWTVVVRDTSAAVTAVENTWRGVKAGFIRWQPPGEPAPLLFRVGDIDRDFHAYNDESVSATFTQEFST